jgi:protein involved in polysaccharide export with SLBB domain
MWLLLHETRTQNVSHCAENASGANNPACPANSAFSERHGACVLSHICEQNQQTLDGASAINSYLKIVQKIRKYAATACGQQRGEKSAIVLLTIAAIVVFGQSSSVATSSVTSAPLVQAAPPANSGAQHSPQGFAKGDAVRISVFPDSLHFVNGVYHIDDSGYVFLPLLGEVRIDTMSTKSLGKLLNSSYVQFLRYPTIQVQPLIRLSLVGGFAKPGLFYVSPSASLWDAVSLAGGPVREDGLKKMTWIRNGKTVSGDLEPIVQSGVSLSTAGVRSGDILRTLQAPKRDRWEIFTTGVLPVLGVTISAVSAAATLYYVYETYNSRTK